METKARVVLIWAWLPVLWPPLSSHRQLRSASENVAGESGTFTSRLLLNNFVISCVAVANLPPSPPASIPPWPALQHHCHTSSSSSFIYLLFRTGAIDPLMNNALGSFSPLNILQFYTKYTQVLLNDMTENIVCRSFTLIH